jgi:hypothetical protein
MANANSWDRKVELERPASEALEAPNAAQAGICLQKLFAVAQDETAALGALVSRFAGRAWRQDYSGGVPLGLVGFAAAVELATAMPRYRDQLLAHALDQLRREGWSDPVDTRSWTYRGELSDAATADQLDRAATQADMREFHGRLVPFINAQARRANGMRYLLARTALDLGAGAHRLLLTDAALKLVQRLAYRHSEQILHPVSHYFLNAEPDYRAATILQDYLQQHGEPSGDNRNREPILDADTRARLIEAVGQAEPAALLDRLTDLWAQKASLEALAEAVQAAALRLLGTSAPEDWALPVRGYLYTGAVANGFEWLRGSQALTNLMMAALFVRSVADAVDRRRPTPPTPKAAGQANAERLASALEAGDREQALAQTAALAGGDGSLLAETLVAASLRDGAARWHGHELPFAAAALVAADRTGADRGIEHYLGLADFLLRPAV